MTDNVENRIAELISELGSDFSILNYIYSSSEKFIPGKSTVLYSGMYWDEKEVVAAISSLLTGTWISAGKKVRQFESQFSALIGDKHGVMVNSGSSANLVLIAALKKYFGWQDGDEILVSVVGFPTTTSAITQNNLTPVFVDIEMDTLNIDLSLVDEKITEKTRAIFLSPVLGNPPNIDEVVDICAIYGIEFILDDCDSLGSKWDNELLNTYAVASSHSFYASHIISTGQGGMVTTNNAEIAKIVSSMAQWGRACFKAGTKIETIDGEKNIEDVSIGDSVYTHLGQYKKILDVSKTVCDESLLRIKCEKKDNIFVTKNHKFLALKNGDNSEKELKWINASNLSVGDILVEKVPNKKDTPTSMKWDYSVFNNRIKKESLFLEPDLMRLCGYWLAEGSLSKADKGSNGKNVTRESQNMIYYKYRVDFSFNSNSISDIEDTKMLMKKYFGVACYSRLSKRGNCCNLSFNTRKGYEFFLKFFGQISYNKKVPLFFETMNNENVFQFLKGFWSGDGSKWSGREDDNRRAAYSFSTSSKDLALRLKKMMLRLHINPSISIRKPSQHNPSLVNGRMIYARRDLYNIQIYGKNAKNFSSLLRDDENNFSIAEKSYFTDNFQYAIFKIRSIEPVDNIASWVYNMSVEDDESYHANGVIAHNCVCSDSDNMLQNGACGHRFAKNLKNYDGIVDHRYVFDNIGFNLKPLDLQGAIGLVQLEKIPEIYRQRNHSEGVIRRLFSKYIDGIYSAKILKNSEPIWFGTSAICKTKELKQKLVKYLEDNKIQTRNYFSGNLLYHDGYSDLGDYRDYPRANEVLDRVFFIGASPHYNNEIFDYIESVLEKFEE